MAISKISQQELVQWPKIKEAETHTIALNLPQALWHKVRVLRNGSETLDLRVHKQHLHIVWPFSSVGLYTLTIFQGPHALLHHQIWVAPRLLNTSHMHLILQELHQYLPFSLALRSQGKGKVGQRFSPASAESVEQAILRLKNIWFGDTQHLGIQTLLSCYPQAYPFQPVSRIEWGRLSQAKKLPQSTWRKWLTAPQETGYQYTSHIKHQDTFVLHMSAFLHRYAQALRQTWIQASQRDSHWIKSTLHELESLIEGKGLSELPYPQAPLRPGFHPLQQAWLHWFKHFWFVPYPDIYLPQGTGFLMAMPHLYQYWLSLHVFASFCQWVKENDFEWRICNPTHDMAPYHTLKRGKSPWGICVHQDLEIAFHVERSFSPSDEIHPPKFRQIPDISLIVSQNQQPVALIIFEIKYKASPQQGILKEDLDKLHAYRDALRYRGNPLVQKALLLTPAHTELLSPDFMVVQGHPESLSEFYQVLNTHVWSTLPN